MSVFLIKHATFLLRLLKMFSFIFSLLKVRVGEYDASGFNPPESVPHQEYTVVKFIKHPRFNLARLDYDLAILTVDKVIDLSPSTVNTVCLPSCDDQFDFRFNNGSGTRCWVAGWGKNAADGTFQFLQHKVDIPLVDSGRCNADLRAAINAKKSGVGNKFALDTSELCAGGEQGKDACTGDGGSPLVCQAQSGRWTVVGLVTWGVGCASKVPGVYARITYFRDWINAN
jgi:secreted trypsin-like serine protease